MQQFVKSVRTTVENRGRKGPPAPSEKEKRKEEKKREEAVKRELDSLIKPTIVQPKVPPGVDPKSFVCEFWKKGMCTRGDKCKV